MRPGELAQRARIAWFRRRWSCADVQGTPRLRAPVLLAGRGSIAFEGDVTFGWEQGPGYLSGYSYVEARNPRARVVVGDGTHFNNGVTIVSEGPGISIGRRCVVGPGVHVYDSDFHAVTRAERGGAPRMAAVSIGHDVFLGTGAMILKGVTVGDGSVVGASAVVVDDVPADTVVAGNPARGVR